MNAIDSGNCNRATGLSVILGAAATLGLSACAGPNIVDERPALSELSPIEQPIWQAGMTQYQIDARSGQESSWTILEVKDGIVTAKNTDGCTWSNRADWFTPALTWDNCGSNPDWSKGIRTITEESGQMWPLKVGNKAIYKHSYETLVTGEKDSAVRTCDVDGAVRINVAAGELDAYKVICTDQRAKTSTVTTWYWAPDLGEVKYTRWHNRRGLEADNEVLRTEASGTS